MSIPFFNNKSTSRSVFALNAVDFEILVNYKLLNLQVLFPWPQESSQSNIRVKRNSQNNKTVHRVFPDFFYLWLKQISLFPFMFPHIFHSSNSSKDTSQLIFNLAFSCLHVCMSSSLVLISYQKKKKKNTRNEYILEKLNCKLSYLRVSVGINTK